MSADESHALSRCGFVAVIGAPNAGKSTLVNALVGAKVSIVTHKVQTTRARIRGVALHDESQIILVDTPGIFKPKRRLDQAMVDAAWSGEADADLVALIVDAQSYSEFLASEDAAKGSVASARDTDLIVEALKKRSRKVVLVLNKIDLMKREDLLKLTEQLHESAGSDLGLSRAPASRVGAPVEIPIGQDQSSLGDSQRLPHCLFEFG